MSDVEDMCAQMTCPVCRGRKTILLLYSRSPCRKCNATGIIYSTFTEDWDGDGDTLYDEEDGGFYD